MISENTMMNSMNVMQPTQHQQNGQNVQPIKTYPEINPLNVKQCFKVSVTANQSLQDQARQYLTECEKNPMFPCVLLEIFYDQKEDKVYRGQIDGIIRQIARVDFPEGFQTLLDYFVANLKAFNDLLNANNPPDFLGDIVFNFFKTLTLVFKDQMKDRRHSSKQNFYNFYAKILAEFSNVWTVFNTNFSAMLGNVINLKNSDQLERFMKLIRMLDKIMLAILCCGFDEIHTEDTILKFMKNIFQKAANYIEFITKFKNEGAKEVTLLLNKNLTKLIMLITHLQGMFPLLFINSLADYLQLIKIIINQNLDLFSSDIVVKAGLWALNKVLNAYTFYTEPAMFQSAPQTPQKYKNYGTEQQLLHQQYKANLTEDTIEGFLNVFILKILPTSKEKIYKSDTSIENLVESESDIQLDEGEKITDNTLYRIAMVTIESLIYRFPAICVKLIHAVAAKAVQSSLTEIPGIFQDSIFALVGLLPKLYQKFKVAPSDYLDIVKVISYLRENAANYQPFTTRIPILINRWIHILSPELMSQLTTLVLSLIDSSKDLVIQYECCMCLKNVIKGDVNLQIDYGILLNKLIPLILTFLDKFLSSNVVWPLISLVNELLTKSQYTCSTQDLINAFQSPIFKKLLSTQSELLQGALVDTFKNIIVTFDPNDKIPSIYTLALEFIDIAFQRPKVDISIVKLWAFLSKEYTPEQGLNDVMGQLFFRHFDKMSEFQEPATYATFLELTEEYILMGFIGENDYGGIIEMVERRYEQTYQAQKFDESVIEIRSSILGIMATIILIYMNKNIDALGRFEKLLGFCVVDIMNQNVDKTIKGFNKYRASIMTLFNRFLIKDAEKILNIVKNNNVDILNFIDNWMLNMEYLVSYAAKRINAIAILQVLPVIGDTAYLKQRFGFLAKRTVPEVISQIKSIQEGSIPNKLKQGIPKPQAAKTRLDDNRISIRKEELRKTQLYETLDLKNLFVTVMQQIMNKHGLDPTTIQALIGEDSVAQDFFAIFQ